MDSPSRLGHSVGRHRTANLRNRTPPVCGSTAQWAALVLSTTLMFNVAAHAATPDACLIFCCTLSSVIRLGPRYAGNTLVGNEFGRDLVLMPPHNRSPAIPRQ